MQYFGANEGRKNCMGPSLRGKWGPKRCKYLHYSQDHQKRPNDHTQSQGKEIDKGHNGKLQSKQHRQQKLSLSRGTNDFQKNTTEQQTWEQSQKTAASRAVFANRTIYFVQNLEISKSVARNFDRYEICMKYQRRWYKIWVRGLCVKLLKLKINV